MSGYKNVTFATRSKLYKILRLIVILFVAVVLVIFLFKQVQVHLTDGGEGGTDGGNADGTSLVAH